MKSPETLKMMVELELSINNISKAVRKQLEKSSNSDMENFEILYIADHLCHALTDIKCSLGNILNHIDL